VRGDQSIGLEFGEERVNLKNALRSATGPETYSDTGGEDAAPDKFIAEGVYPERVLLVGVSNKNAKRDAGYSLEESLEELGSLAETAGLNVVKQTYQNVDAPSPATYVGSGKLAEIKETVEKDNISTVIFDEELSPVQLMNIEKYLGDAVRICDRTALTLDIFSQHALSKEGQLQVELAQYKYQLPRLTRMWTHLERQAAGAGGDRAVKGMGEKQIEVDKRILRRRMASISRELEEVKLHRRLKRSRRAERDMPVVTLVGYTNAGKSSLMNKLTDAEVLVEDKLFATLDPTTRRVKLPGGKTALLTDTVGFIQRLPPQLVAAFSATLEELLDSTLLLHVVDVNSPQTEKQQKAVLGVLESIGARDLPVLTVWNKCDQLSDKGKKKVYSAARKRQNTHCVSAASGEGLEDLLVAIEQSIEESMVPVFVLIPYKHGDIVQRVHAHGIVKNAMHNQDGTFIEASVPLYLAAQLKPFKADLCFARRAQAAV